jgi:hypothetical protein
VVSGVSIGCIAYLDCDFASKRGAAYVREAGRAIRGGVQEPTDRGQDKSRQCAAWSVGCFCLVFSLFQQCAASLRKVPANLNSFLTFVFLHIAGARNG